MSTQVTLRLPTALVEFIDAEVEHGRASSRAAVVARAVEREQRRALALRDAEILAETARGSDLTALAEHSAATPLHID